MTLLSALVDKALLSGASDATILGASQIKVSDELAGLCGEPQCEHFGASPSCPPHVGGPDAFRQWQMVCPHAVALKIDLPARVLFSDERPQVMRLLHEIVAEVEQTAVQMGFGHSKGFAGGSCKQLFCSERPQCRVMATGGGCRHPQHARSSMSGYGVHVAEMMASAGWSDQKAIDTLESDSEAMSWVAGLVLVG